jgi:glutamate dehydrogenase
MTDAPAPEDGLRPGLLAAAEAALHRAAPALPPAAAGLLHRLFAAVPTAELAATAPETLAEAAASLFAFATTRTPGEAKLRILPPGPGRGAAPVVEIVTDDMPFLVDSALAALARRGRVVRQLLHPIIPLTRDAEGRVTAVGDGARESMMRIALAPGSAPTPNLGEAPDPDDLGALRDALARALRDVRAAVADFAPMLAMLRTAEAEVAVEEATAFLRWLAEENFVLLGHRRLMLTEAGATVATEENLGLLRDASLPVFDALRDLPALPEAVRATLAQLPAVNVAKANMRATVHRPQHADVVITRIRDDAGRVISGRLFLGLFAAAAYNRNPRSIPLLRAKVLRILAAAGLEPETHDGRALRNILDTWPRDELFQAPDEAILAGCLRALDLSIRPRAGLVLRRDPFERFVSAIAWLPRDTFDTAMRERIGALLAGAFAGRLSAFATTVGDAPLARVHYVIGTTPGAVPAVDDAALEAALAQAARGFRDRLEEALLQELGEAASVPILAQWRDAFPRGDGALPPARGGTAPAGAAPCASWRAAAAGRCAAALRQPRSSRDRGSAASPDARRATTSGAACLHAGGRSAGRPLLLRPAAGCAGRVAGWPRGGGWLQPPRARRRARLARMLAAARDVPLAEAGRLRLRAGERRSRTRRPSGRRAHPGASVPATLRSGFATRCRGRGRARCRMARFAGRYRQSG